MSSRRFRLIRHHDVSGVSGTGPVAEGVQFTDGAVALRWYGDYPTTTVWDAIESVIAIHGHSGATEVEWLDPDPGRDPVLKLKPHSDLPPRPWPDLHPAPEPLPEPELEAKPTPDQLAPMSKPDLVNDPDPLHGPDAEFEFGPGQHEARAPRSTGGLAPRSTDIRARRSTDGSALHTETPGLPLT
jgi:hypothetical protein